MNRENMINILEKVSNKNDLCYISSKTKYSLELSYAIKYNEKFLMVADTCDYKYDGYIIIKWENIEEIEYNKRAIFESKIIKNENGKPDIENVIDIKLDSYKTIFNHFLNKNENITIYCDSCSEKYVDEDYADKHFSFKVHVRRADKKYPIPSMEATFRLHAPALFQR